VKKRSARWDMLCGEEKLTEGVGGVQNEQDEFKFRAVECQQGLRSTETSGGAP